MEKHIEKRQEWLKKAKRGINWEKARAAFLKAETMHAGTFLKDYLKIDKITTFQWQKMKGWAEQKKELLEWHRKEGEELAKSEILEAYKPTVDMLNKMKKTSFNIIQAKLLSVSSHIQKDDKGNLVITGDINIVEIEKILKIIKTELGEPTSINQSNLWDEDAKILQNITSITIK